MITNPYRARALVFLLFAALLLVYLLLDAQNTGRKPERHDASADEEFRYEPETDPTAAIRTIEQAVLEAQMKDTTGQDASWLGCDECRTASRPAKTEVAPEGRGRETLPVTAGPAPDGEPPPATGDPRLLREISRATAAERYDRAAQLLIESRAGERLLVGDPVSRAEWQRRLSRGFAILARETGMRDAAADARRLMADTRVADVVNTLGLDERGMRRMLETYYDYRDRERSAPGNPRPLDIEPLSAP